MKKTFLSALMLLIFLLGGCATHAPQSAENGNGTATQTTVSSSLQEETAQQTDAPSKEETERETNSELPEEMPQRNEKADAILQQMTVEEKVGQLFIIRPTADVQSPEEEPLKSLLNYPVGGIIFFAPNIVDPKQLTAFTQTLQAGSKIPLFLSIDEEGGSVARIAKNTAFDVKTYKSAASVAKNGDPQEAKEMGFTIGSYLKQYGFNLNFAPVADVNTNPKNPIIGSRAFSSDPLVADQMAKAMASGLQQAGVAPVFKHFPGHGDTKEDSHDGLATSNKALEELQNCELIPFQNLPESSCVMVGHIALPQVAQPHVPASLSKTVVTDLLRGQMGFEGVIITDSLAMGAIKNTYPSGQAAVLAIQAGCDILLDPTDLTSAFQGVCDAIAQGTISEERLNESVYRILCLKDSLGLLKNR